MEQVFKDNPRLDVCYKTSDNKCFFTPNDAHNYATNLEDKRVSKLVRPLVVEKQENSNNELDEKIQELKTLELEKANYNQMKSLVKYFDLKVEDQKTETLLEALEKYKKQISQ